MKKFKPYTSRQRYLLPPSPQDWLPPNHVAYFIDEIVDELDLKAIYRKYEGEKRGQPPYHPQMMVKVWLYGYCKRIRSSRKLEQALYEDIGFRMLSGDQQPDHWTLSEFRRRHKEALGDLFWQTVQLANGAGLVKLDQVAVDGTKIKAYASKHAAMSYGRMEKEERRLREDIAHYFTQVEKTDEQEDAIYGDRRGDELPPELASTGKRLKAIREAMRALEQQAQEKIKRQQEERADKATRQGKSYHPRKDPGQIKPFRKAQRNFTDPDSRIMVDGNKAFIQGYNAQAAVDVESQVIVACDLSNQAADAPHLISVVQQIKENTGKVPNEVLADAGYFSARNVEELSKEMAVLIPPDKIRHREWRQGSSPPANPPGEDASVADKMRYLLKLPENRERYRKREQSVEPVFGQIKEARGLRQFLLRGLENVKCLWKLECAVHNLLKIHKARMKLAPAR